MRPIDADALYTLANNQIDESCYTCERNENCFDCVLRRIPTLDVAPVVHAHWIEESYEYYKAWQEAFGTENFFRDCEYFTDHIACSNCLKSYNIMDNDSAGCWKFCPNCGAKIDGKDDDQNADE